MKKLVSCILILAMAISLCACGKSEAVKAAEEQIDFLSENYSSTVLMDTIQVYDALSDEEKERIDNYDVIVKYATLFTTYELQSAADTSMSTLKRLARAWETSVNLYLEKRVNYFAMTHMCLAIPAVEEDVLEAMAELNYIESVDSYSDETIYEILAEPSLTINVVKKLYTNDGTLEEITNSINQIEKVIKYVDKSNEYYDTAVEYYAALNSMCSYLRKPYGSYVNLGEMIEEYSLLISSSNAKLRLS